MTDESPRSERPRVLVVDDEPHIRRMLSMVLGAEGFTVKTASDGASGLRALEGGRVDLVVLDLVMPDANGLEILARIRTDQRLKSIPVIILTAKGQDTDREAALAGGADDFMTKPFSPKKLIARIRELVGVE